MAITDTINSMKAHISNAYDEAQLKEATIPEKKNLENLAECISSIQQGSGEEYYWKPQPDWDDISKMNDDINIVVADIEPYVEFLITGDTQGEYSVDWGDGNSEKHTGNSFFYHTYEQGSGKPCSKGYTTFTIKINRTNKANIITTFRINKSSGFNVGVQSWKWIICRVGGSMTTFNVAYAGNNVGADVYNPYLECVELPEEMPSITSLSYGFNKLNSLEKLVLPKSAPKLNNLNYCCSYCPRLKEVNIPNAPALREMSYFVQNTPMLKKITWEGEDYPVLNTMTYAFSFCGIEEISMPKMTPSAISYLFYISLSLKKVTFADNLFFRDATTVAGFIGSNCGIEIADFSDFDAPEITTFQNFSASPFIKILKFPKAVKLTTTSSMVSTNMPLLEELYFPPEFGSTSNPTYLLSIKNAGRLKSFKGNCGLNFSRIVLAPSSGRSALTEAEIPYQTGKYTGAAPQIDFSSSNLDREAMVRIIDALPTLSGKTIKLSNCAGSMYLTNEDIAIANAKGWTVTK